MYETEILYETQKENRIVLVVKEKYVGTIYFSKIVSAENCYIFYMYANCGFVLSKSVIVNDKIIMKAIIKERLHITE